MEKLLTGGIDLHVHTSPSVYNRKMDDFELLYELDSIGMSGAVIKNHYGDTSARAQIANKYANTKAKLYGSITLNQNTGGLNPYAIQIALYMGVKMVWLPTFHSRNGLEYLERTHKKPLFAGSKIHVLDEGGNLLPVVYDIIEIIGKHNAVLQTGHLSPQESYKVAVEALIRKVKVVITHVDGFSTLVPIDMQLQLARKGAFIDKCWNNLWRGCITAEKMVKSIKEISAERCVLTTDRGQIDRESPIEGLEKFVHILLQNGVTENEISQMIKDNPKYLLGLK